MCRHIERFVAGALAGLVALAAVDAAYAQGLLVNTRPDEKVRLPRPIVVPPRRPLPREDTYAVKAIEVEARLVDQVAQVQVSQSFVNTGSQPIEVSFIFPLPYDGAVEQLTLLVDGKEYPARLLTKEEARRIYEEIVRKNQDPALLEWIGAGMFQTSVFPVPAGQQRTVVLRYSQLCRLDRGLTDFLFPLSTAKYSAKPVEVVSLRLSIESRTEIKNVYSPTHQVEVKRDGRRATVSYRAEKQVPISDFRLLYDVGQGPVAASALSYRRDDKDDGYFLLLASPEIKSRGQEQLAKTVVFVVDRSGSMSGQKIEQARDALRFVLNNLRKGDLFNIVVYDDRVESFRPELQRFDETARREALGFVDGIYAGGSTNIDAALDAALAQLTDSSRPSYVVFLTDGLPTAGETNESRIIEQAKGRNQVRARLISLGVGYDVNSRLLDRLARANFGQTEYVRPNEDIEARVSRLYERIRSPVLADVKIAVELDEDVDRAVSAVNRVYPRDVYDLFAGEQLVIVGRYKRPGSAKVVVRGRVGDKEHTFDFPAELVDKSKDATYSFIEKLWATRRIGEIIDELDLKGRNEELIKELVELSQRHGVLTPYTAFLADETTTLGDVAANAVEAGRLLRALDAASGQAGFAQRAAKEAMQSATTPALVDGAGTFGGAFYYEAERDRRVVVDTVRNVGAKSFFQRGGQWVDSTVSEEQRRQARRVEQFSREYFDLAARHGRDLAPYLALDEPVVVNVEGQTYLIEPPAD